MKRVLIKLFKGVLLSIIFILLGLIFIGTYFLNTSPQFGSKPNASDLERIAESKNYKNNKFVNPIKTTTGDFLDVLKSLPKYINLKRGAPRQELPTDYQNTNFNDSLFSVQWFGHSSFLIKTNGTIILIDPMLGKTPTPFSFGTKRFKMEDSIPIHEITKIDLVLFSHDHYDHLDYPTIEKIKDKVSQFYVPLGLGSHLKGWGVSDEKIREFDWWDKDSWNGIDFVSVPSRHFSGRGITDANKTLWCGWVVDSPNGKIYFSGDSGYGPHFKEIGEKHGPFDLAMIECGQYDEAWPDIHMMPEQSVLAGKEAKGKVLMPIHWGAFQLAIHPWDDPIKRFVEKSRVESVDIIYPLIGETFHLGNLNSGKEWWLSIN